ncbi:MAG: glycosyltransferase [Alphaproteobacteria bacterium]
MKVLVVARLFSGLAESLAQRRWQPSGVPAIHKLIEGLADAKDVQTELAFLVRDADARFARAERVPLPPLNLEAQLLPWRGNWPNWANELSQAWAVIKLVRRLRPDVVYATNAGFIGAALVSRLGLAPVVLRFLGIFPAQKRMTERRTGLARWFYRAPFAHAVCTLDGSGPEHYLPRLLRKDVKLSILLNGVDRRDVGAEAARALRGKLRLDARPVVMFLGRLEKYKGADEFVEALAALEKIRPGAFQGLIVGDGPLTPSLSARLNACGLAGRVAMTDAVRHDQVPDYLAAGDIYVSLNRYGGLSNANLEALAAGRCTLMLAGDPADHTDSATDRLLPADIVERLPRDNTQAALAARLAELLDRPAEIAARAARTLDFARTHLDTWPARIAKEIDIIRAAARREPSLATTGIAS